MSARVHCKRRVKCVGLTTWFDTSPGAKIVSIEGWIRTASAITGSYARIQAKVAESLKKKFKKKSSCRETSLHPSFQTRTPSNSLSWPSWTRSVDLVILAAQPNSHPQTSTRELEVLKVCSRLRNWQGFRLRPFLRILLTIHQVGGRFGDTRVQGTST